MPLNVKHEFRIKLLTNDDWILILFEKFIHSINNIYYTLYVCDDIIHKLKINDKKSDVFSRVIEKIGVAESIKHKLFTIDFDRALFIQSIHMGSPGEINLRGAGEILHELRELIKDLSYRNKQECEMGQLNILEKKLEIMRKYGIPKNELDKILLSANEDCQVLIDLEKNGYLGNLVDFKA